MAEESTKVKVGKLEVVVIESTRRITNLDSKFDKLDNYLRNDLPHKLDKTYATKIDLKERIKDINDKYDPIRAIVVAAVSFILLAFLATIVYFIGWKK